MNNWNFTGDAVVSFSVAVDFGYGEKKGALWPKCTIFGKRGEAVAPYLKKGQQVAVSGELSESKWTNKEGVEQKSLELRVNDVTLVGGKSDGGETKPASKGVREPRDNSDEQPY